MAISYIHRGLEFSLELELCLELFTLSGMEVNLAVVDKIMKVPQGLRGFEMIQSIAKNISLELDVKYVFIGRPKFSNPSVLLTDIAVANGMLVKNFEYSLIGSPCQNVVSQLEPCVWPVNVLKNFNSHQLLNEMKVQSYVGAPILSESQNLIGILVMLDTKPMKYPELMRLLAQFFSSRISAELSRYEMEDKLRAHNENLSHEVKLRTAELEEEVRKNRILLATVFHDLSNPLMILATYIKRFKNDPSKADEYLQRMDLANKNIVAIIKNLKMLLAENEYIHESEYRILSVKDIYANLRELFADSLGNKGINFRFEGDGEIKIRVPETIFMNAILGNYLSNAIKFSPMSAEILFMSEKKDNKIYLSIKDQGQGIPEAVLSSLGKFQKNKSTLGTADEVGTGYGMLIAYTYLKLMNAQLEVESSEQGTKVTAVLLLDNSSISQL